MCTPHFVAATHIIYTTRWGAQPHQVNPTGDLLKVLWQSSEIALPSCALYLADLGQYLYSKGGCTRLSTLEQLPAAMV